MAALPPFGAFFGKSALEGALTHTPGYGWVPAVLVLGVAAWALAGPPEWRPLKRLQRLTTGGIIALRRMHSGCVNDYVAGLAVIDGALALV